MTNIDTYPIADDSERRQALTPDKSFIIQAPAGSGKTGLLIQRYLRLLSLVDSPEEIVAMTFTRKAAAEMQGRILSALEKVVSGQEAENDYEKITFRLASSALERDKKQGWKLLDNPTRLRIQTIDSFCASLTRQMPVLAKLGTQPETLEDAEVLYQQAAINTLAELDSGMGWSDSIVNLALHLDNNLPRIKNLIVAMLRKRDQWLAYVVQDHDREDMQGSLANIIEEQLGYAVGLFHAAMSDELIPLLRFAAKHLNDADPDNPISQCSELNTLPSTGVDGLTHWKAICELLLTKNGSWRKQFNKKIGFPAASDNKLEADERSQRKKQAQELITELQKIDGLQACLINIRQLPPARYTDSEWQIINALCELLKLAAAQLRLIFAERNQMDFIGIAESALTALGTESASTELAATLDYHIKHILVDEYQDISANQYRLLQGLTREWSVDDGRSLFLVGDPMQSIYRFREAEVGLYIKTFQQQGLGNVPLEALRLKVNFRSQQALVEWVNEHFDSILPDKDDVLSGAVSFSNATAYDQSATNNNVVVYPLYGRQSLKEAEHTVGIINELRQQDSEQAIAILVRSRSHLVEIVPALRQADIAFKAIDIEGLGTRSEIQDLLALTRACLFPADRIAWLACLRAPWCGLRIDSLLKLSTENRDKSVWQCINDQTLIETLERDEQRRLIYIRKSFQTFFEQRHRLSLRDSIESLWCELGGPATLSKAIELENCEAFLGLLESLDHGGAIEDLQELSKQVNQLFAAPDHATENPVQIMTMHKAKGLEFDHVILPGLGRSARSDQTELLAWLLRQGQQGQGELILAPIRKSGEDVSPIYDYISRIDKNKQVYEDARLLYVAATRAKKTLHLIGHASLKQADEEIHAEPQSRSLLAKLWSAVSPVYQQYLPNEFPEDDSTSYVVINQENRRLSQDWRLPEPKDSFHLADRTEEAAEQEQTLIEFEWAGETIKHIGSVVHRAIQWIAEEGVEEWRQERIKNERDTFEHALQQLGVPKQERTDALHRVEQALINMLEDERGQWTLSKAHQQQQNEYALSGIHNNKLINVILDRTFIDETGVRWIIDYKTSRHEGSNKEAFLDHEQERYQAQLEKYAALMNAFEDTEIKLGLYFPLLKGWREWVYHC